MSLRVDASLIVTNIYNKMVEVIHKYFISLGIFSSEIRHTKVFATISASVIITAIFVVLVGLTLSYLWTPFKSYSAKSPPNQTVSNALVSSFVTVNGQLNGLNRLNFLPDMHELEVQDDVILDAPKLHHKIRQWNTTPENDLEASLALHMALQMREAGKLEKATKIFQHALALNPLHPDVLNHYGEFLEEHRQDVIKANQLYTKAVIVCPQHSKALVNIERTLPVVEELDAKHLLRINKKRDHLYKIPESDPALKRVKKEAYFQHIHHTVAIEGNTMTLAETRMIVETRMAVPGKSILEHNEIIGLEAALKYINSTLVSKHGFITIEDILEIHRRVLGNADPLGAGTFRRSQVFVGDHTPPPASQVLERMDDLLDWMNSEETYKMHPVKFAALAHFKLVHIHPFVDGNGRTGRLLMNLILMRAGYPPVIIRKQDRSVYYEFLHMADDGDVRPLIRFIAKCTEQTLDVYLYATEYGINGVRALGGHEELDKNIQITEIS